MPDFIPLTPVSRPASNPGGDIACDITIATPDARAGLAQGLRSGIVSVRDIEGGVEATFRPEASDAVRQYINLESQCCSFLSLAARPEGDHLLLAVTGGPEAQDWIRNIFSDTTFGT